MHGQRSTQQYMFLQGMTYKSDSELASCSMGMITYI